jgi:hypothetical protein
MLTDNGFLKENSDKLKYYGFSTTILTLIAAIIQADRNHDWNRRHTATTALLEIKDKILPHTQIIHETFGYQTRSENDTIRTRDIHEKICVKNGDTLVRDQDSGKLRLDDQKKHIYRAIWETLNLYEYIASGVYQGVFDKAIVADLLEGNIIKIASVFSNYIDHVNEDMYPRRGGKIWANIRDLGKEFKAKYRDSSQVEPRNPA